MSKDNSNVKVKATEGQDFKPFAIEVREPNLRDREKMMNLIMKTELRDFSTLIQIIKMGTDYSDQELNQFSNDQLAGMCNAIVESWSKKK